MEYCGEAAQPVIVCSLTAATGPTASVECWCECVPWCRGVASVEDVGAKADELASWLKTG